MTYHISVDQATMADFHRFCLEVKQSMNAIEDLAREAKRFDKDLDISSGSPVWDWIGQASGSLMQLHEVIWPETDARPESGPLA